MVERGMLWKWFNLTNPAHLCLKMHKKQFIAAIYSAFALIKGSGIQTVCGYEYLKHPSLL